MTSENPFLLRLVQSCLLAAMVIFALPSLAADGDGNEPVSIVMAYKAKPPKSWRADDWGLLDALNKMLTLRASSRHHALRNDAPAVRDAQFWAKLDKELEFYYEAAYPGKELEKEIDDE